MSSILGRLPLVPLGETGTIPFEMRKELRSILQYAEYNQYEPCTIFFHIIYHVDHPDAGSLPLLLMIMKLVCVAYICKIIRNPKIHMHNMSNNMSNNMQNMQK